jgi:transcriptional regulator with GAF, ATPase, and Fis domain
LNEKTTVRLDENEFFRQATLRICSSLNVGTALSRFMEYLKPFVPLSGMCLGLFDEDLKSMRAIATAGESEHKPPDIVRFSDDVWLKIREKEGTYGPIFVVNDVVHHGGEPFEVKFMDLMFRSRDLSAIFMELKLEEQRLGSFIAYAVGTNRFKMEHVRLLSLIHDPLAVAMSNILRHQEVVNLKDMLADDNRFFQQQLLELSGDQIIGADSGLKGVIKMMHQVAPLDSPVMLLGETGVGKEVIANAIHNNSRRSKGPFIKVNCGAIPMDLMDSELFGHEKGAFTGAIERTRGRFERADGGTIFLDEIGDLSLAAQVRLLRVLQTKEFDRVGGSQTVQVDARVISATNKNLADLVTNSKFREDLYYRLNVYPITIPPLRHRKEDIPVLLRHFFDRKSRELRIHPPTPLSGEALNRLTSYHWPGNVRELENWVERAIIHSQGRINEPLEGSIFVEAEATTPEADFSQGIEETVSSLEHATKTHISQALKRCNGKVEGPNGAATLLKMNPSTLWSKMRKLGIHPRNFRDK